MSEDEKVSLNAFESYTQNRLDNMWDKISDLEKKLDKLKCYDFGKCGDNTRCDGFGFECSGYSNPIHFEDWERIEKLEGRSKGLDNEVGFHHKQIDELKEQMKEFDGEIDILINSLGRSNKSIYILRKVLRKFLKLDSEPWDTDHYVKILQLLDKLKVAKK